MFLTILVMPTAFLQANVLVSMKYEKLDMWLNIISLITYLTFCLVGIHFFKSLSVINISIFIGFVFFHILQDVILVQKKVSSNRYVFEFYALNVIIIGSYILLDKLLKPVVLFPSFWIVIFCIGICINKLKDANKIIALFKINH
jgi:O-antigen/teichoic acid export membrane protein